MRFAVDTGGTFTDLVVENDDGSCSMFKARTTPEDPVAGVLDALGVAAEAFGMPREELLSRGGILIHGTTHAINAIITGRTAKTAFITTEGHGDMLVLREGGRADTFNFTQKFPEPYVPRRLTFEVPERIYADGSIIKPLETDAVLAIIEALKEKQVEAVGVCLLWSIANSDHEEQIAALFEEHLPDVPYTLSHRLNPAIREFRRASSVVVDASLKPMMGRYMRSLEGRLRDAGFNGRTLVLTSQAGVIDAADAAESPIHIVNSGPSMAPVAGRFFAGQDSGISDAIIADTGGTTYDVSIVRKGRIPTSRETWIGPRYRGVMIGLPWIDVRSVGAGGGSIAWIDSGGLLHVGPQSAGSDPGPVAYGRGGTQPTVTDASLMLGHIDPDFFLGGSMSLDLDAAENAIRTVVAEPLGLDVASASDAIITIATESMVQAINDITVNQGIDPQEVVLVGGGGAAGLNSVRIARRLGCRQLIIPEVGAALSAAGALMSDLKAEYYGAFFATTADFDHEGSQRVLDGLGERCREFAEGPGANSFGSRTEFRVSARYATQVWDIEVPLRGNSLATQADVDGFIEDFHAAHKALFSFADPASPIEIIGWTAQVSCSFSETPALRLSSNEESGEPRARKTYFGDTGWIESKVFPFGYIEPGVEIEGPAIIENSFTTIVVDPGAVARRKPSGTLVIDV
ncbi:hydantoinase/oxoprolinase family protein [Hoeflea sp. WL0058]|uniref:Hydantoinase/oxoprolinase family protein n=1 Tax=Flavimaribacter sediminis TaxID=2865987 RepID=A0AAE2ZMK3_9HYPH|nr:hydantoinase/oxoprolinase family protein [Flavimaribacter sediminis]MBW8638729.1 hydantoinase/oxoprolinase family protein [Flavimaribacter sediminis]